MPARPVAGWTAPPTPRAKPADAQAFNPVQAWTTLFGNIAGLQRQAWANALAATTPKRSNDN
jgi:hypothetical protein